VFVVSSQEQPSKFSADATAPLRVEHSGLEHTLVDGRFWPSSTAEGATTNGGHANHSGRCWLERPLYDAPLSLISKNWPAQDDPKPKLLDANWLPESRRRGDALQIRPCARTTC